MPIVWRPRMSVANHYLDNDHRYLICLVNTVELALRHDADPETLRLALDQLLEYTHEHFEREELLQIKVRYPGYAAHKLEHQEILGNLERAREQVLGGGDAGGEGVAQEPVRADELDALLGGSTPDVAVEGPSREASPAAAAQGLSEQTELVQLMRRWILEHVLQTDAKLRPYLSKFPPNLT
jgi:hemerythrin